jgi:hypothetical protein
MWIAGRRPMGSNHDGPVRPLRPRENRPIKKTRHCHEIDIRGEEVCPKSLSGTRLKRQIGDRPSSGRCSGGTGGTGGSTCWCRWRA